MRGLSALAVVLALAAPALAAVDPADIEPTGPPNAAYLDAVPRGVQAEIIYMRPSAAFDPEAIAEGEPPRPPRTMDAEAERRTWGIVFGVLLVAVLVFAAWFGGRIPVSFRGRAADGCRRGPETAGETAAAPPLPADAFLDRLRAMADRRMALILLVGRALEAAAAANGLRIGRAQTARDVLGAVPRRWPHFDALRRLVREAEVVHFGGRDLPEARWRECVEAARPLLAGGRPA